MVDVEQLWEFSIVVVVIVLVDIAFDRDGESNEAIDDVTQDAAGTGHSEIIFSSIDLLFVAILLDLKRTTIAKFILNLLFSFDSPSQSFCSRPDTKNESNFVCFRFMFRQNYLIILMLILRTPISTDGAAFSLWGSKCHCVSFSVVADCALELDLLQHIIQIWSVKFVEISYDMSKCSGGCSTDSGGCSAPPSTPLATVLLTPQPFLGNAFYTWEKIFTASKLCRK